MKTTRRGILGTALLLAATSTGWADRMPTGAKIAPESAIVKAYAGNTDLWKRSSCNGGLFYAHNRQARAWCKESPQNLGAGTWSASDNGTLCYTLDWYWPDGDKTGVTKGEEVCVAHVVDRRGRLWRNWGNDNEWWVMRGPTGVSRGYKFHNDVLQTRENLGL